MRQRRNINLKKIALQVKLYDLYYQKILSLSIALIISFITPAKIVVTQL